MEKVEEWNDEFLQTVEDTFREQLINQAKWLDNLTTMIDESNREVIKNIGVSDGLRKRQHVFTHAKAIN
ncbi:hypothetical protein [Nitrospira sp. M1]